MVREVQFYQSLRKQPISLITNPDEEARLAAVRRYDILDTPPDGTFDNITAMAARRFSAPIAIISIVDHDRIWFKSHHGLDVRQIDREPGLCASAILGSQPYVLNDASVDPRSLANPLVAGEFGLRFYAAVPLRTADNFNLGTLCVIDHEPRDTTQEEIADLEALASLVIDQMELRIAARRAVSHAELMAREIDHRVMNSLQFVSSLLSLQARSPGIANAETELKLAADRVAAVSKIHDHFLAADAAQTQVKAFVERLCGDLSNVVGRTVRVTGDETTVETKLIQPIGLIVNELVMNSAKHGKGDIQVDLKIADGRFMLCVEDEGNGPPLEPAAADGSGLGMRVVRSLTDQLRGHFRVSPKEDGQGTRCEVSFPAPA